MLCIDPLRSITTWTFIGFAAPRLFAAFWGAAFLAAGLFAAGLFAAGFLIAIFFSVICRLHFVLVRGAARLTSLLADSLAPLSDSKTSTTLKT
jgi:hypothetical protein